MINNLPEPFDGAMAHVTIYNLDGSVAYEQDSPVSAPAATASSLGPVEFPSTLSDVHFIQADLRDSAGKLVSTNFYWRAKPEHEDDLTDLNKLPMVTLEAQIARTDADGKCVVTVTLKNTSSNIALMTHVQLRRKKSGERVLPVFYDNNYVSLVPNEQRTITIEAGENELNGEDALVMVDGWNTTVAPASATGVAIAPNDGCAAGSLAGDGIAVPDGGAAVGGRGEPRSRKRDLGQPFLAQRKTALLKGTGLRSVDSRISDHVECPRK